MRMTVLVKQYVFHPPFDWKSLFIRVNLCTCVKQHISTSNEMGLGEWLDIVLLDYEGGGWSWWWWILTLPRWNSWSVISQWPLTTMVYHGLLNSTMVINRGAGPWSINHDHEPWLTMVHSQSQTMVSDHDRKPWCHLRKHGQCPWTTIV